MGDSEKIYRNKDGYITIGLSIKAATFKGYFIVTNTTGVYYLSYNSGSEKTIWVCFSVVYDPTSLKMKKFKN
tara:strand:+ start:620 stop:835 length:216 start_codon:yes stop_codon:yes gene_type:complete